MGEGAIFVIVDFSFAISLIVATAVVTDLAKQIAREGKKVISLSVGEPDHAPPAEVIEATGIAAREGFTK